MNFPAILVLVSIALGVSAYSIKPRMYHNRIQTLYKQSFAKVVINKWVVRNRQTSTPGTTDTESLQGTAIHLPRTIQNKQETVINITIKPKTKRITEKPDVPNIHIQETEIFQRKHIEKRAEPNFMDAMYGGFGRK